MFEDDGRIQISFDGKPAAELRQLCKGAGFVPVCMGAQSDRAGR